MKKITIIIAFTIIFINTAKAQSQSIGGSVVLVGIMIILGILLIIWLEQDRKTAEDKSSTNNKKNKSNVNLLKNIINIAIAIQIVIIGVTTYKLVDAEAFRTYPDTPYGSEYANDNGFFIGNNPSLKDYGNSKYDHFSLSAINNGGGLKTLREEHRSEEIKSIVTSFVIATCLLWLIVFLIKRTKDETNK